MIIDFHTHIFPSAVKENPHIYRGLDPGFREMYSNPRARIATADELVRAMDEAGIQTAVACAFGWASRELCARHNDAIIDAVQRYPERLIGFFAVDPGDQRAALHEIDRCVQAGLKGVGELRPDNQGWDLTEGGKTGYLVEVFQERGLPLLMHTSEPVGHTYPGKGRETPDRLEKFIQQHPHLTLVLAHWGGGLPFYALMPEVREALAQVYVDTAASPYLYSSQVYRMVAQILGADKILFGSDYPLMPYPQALKQVEEAGLSAKEREQVLQGNARRLLGLGSSGAPGKVL